MHSAEYYEPYIFKNKRVLVIGKYHGITQEQTASAI